MDLKKHIRPVPDFPKKGILFRDITTLLNNPSAFRHAIDSLVKKLPPGKIDVVMAAESRGFILGSVLAYKLKAAFVPVRKPGKLPYKTFREKFMLEYGEDAFEVHQDAFKKGRSVLIVDDLLATGGTAGAMVNLVKKLKGKVKGVLFLIELTALNGRSQLKGYPVYSVIQF